MDGIVPLTGQRPRQCGRKLRIHKELQEAVRRIG